MAEAVWMLRWGGGALRVVVKNGMADCESRSGVYGWAVALSVIRWTAVSNIIRQKGEGCPFNTLYFNGCKPLCPRWGHLKYSYRVSETLRFLKCGISLTSPCLKIGRTVAAAGTAAPRAAAPPQPEFIPKARRDCCAAVVDCNRWFIHGGSGHDGRTLSDAATFDFRTCLWTEVVLGNPYQRTTSSHQWVRDYFHRDRPEYSFRFSR